MRITTQGHTMQNDNNQSAINDALQPINKPNQLLKVALINSYLKNQSHIIHVDNNNLLTGKNAAGKTSLMNAIAPFYGVPLSVLSRKTEASKSFLDHFLPNDNSYIIYEYSRADERRCVILRRLKERPCFNFFTGSLDDSFFLGDRRNGGKYFKTYEEIRQAIEDAGHVITPNFTQSEYEAIISNAASNRLKFDDQRHQSAKTIARYRHDFSLTTGKKSTFYGFARILSNIMESKLSFDDLTHFLIEAMRTQGIIDRDSIKFDASNIDTSSWVSQRETWLAIDKLKPQFSELDECLKNNFTNQTQLADTQLLLKDILAKLEIQFRSVKEAHADQVIISDNLAKQLSDIEIQWHTDSSNLTYDINRKTKEIDDIEAKKSRFELGTKSGSELSLHSLKQLASELPMLESQKSDLEDKRTFYKEQMEDKKYNVDMINQQHDAEMKRLASVKNDKLSQAKLDESNVDRDYEKQVHIIEQDHAKIMRAYSDQYQQERDRLQFAINNINVELAKLDERIASVRYSDIHKSAIDDNTSKLEQLREDKDAILIEADQANKVIVDIDQQIASISNNQTRRKSALEDVNTKIASQRTLIQGNTLFSFLLNSESDLGYEHVSRVRKVIHQDLLSMSNLKPAWTESAATNDDIFGLKIDTANIISPKEQSQTLQEILEFIDSLDRRSAELNTEITNDKTELDELGRQRASALTNRHQIAARLSKIVSDISNLKENSKYLVAKANEDMNQRREQIAVDKKLREDELEKFIKQQDLANQTKKDQDDLASETRKNRVSEADRLKAARLVDIKIMQKNAATEYDENTAAAKIIRDQAITNEGYDPKIINAIEKEIAGLAQHIFKAEKANTRIDEYNLFMEEEYPHVDILNDEKHGIEDAYKKAKTLYEDQLSSTNVNISKGNSEVNRLTSLATQLKTDTEHLTDQSRAIGIHLNNDFIIESGYHPKVSDVKAEDAHLLSESAIRTAQQNIKAASITTNKGRTLISQIKKPFDLNSASFGRLVSDPDYIGLANETNWHKRANLFIDYINNEHETRLETIIQGYKSISEQLNNFKYKLDLMNTHLKMFARLINQNFIKICDNLDSIAIEVCRLELESTIEKNEWYKTLTQFSDAYSHWQGSERLSNPLPSENLISNIEMVQKHIGQSQLNINLADQFLISLTVKQYGQPARTATRDGSVKDLSSNGTMRIAQLMVYLSLAQTLVRTDCTELKLFIDEIGVIDKDNTKELIELLASQRLSAMCAAPEVVDDAIIPLFSNNTRCTHDRNNIYRMSQTADMDTITHEYKMADHGAFDLPKAKF